MDEAEPLWRDVDDYFGRMLIAEDDALVGARQAGEATTMPHAEVAPNQGKLLGLLAQMVGARRVLEFGTLAGYSTVWLARAVGPDGHVTTLELEPQNAAVAQETLQRAGLHDRVEVMVGPAVESARELVRLRGGAVRLRLHRRGQAEQPGLPGRLARADPAGQRHRHRQRGPRRCRGRRGLR